MNLVSLALRNLGRRPVRTSLTVIGIAVAVGSALVLMALSRSIQDGTREGLGEIGGDLVVMPGNAPDIFSAFIPESALERISTVPGVARVSGELVTFAPSGAASSVLAFGWSEGSYLWKRVPLREGRVPAPGETNVAVLGDSASLALGRKLNDQLSLFGETFRVVGISGYTASINRGLVIVPLADLQRASYRPRQITVAHVSVDEPKDRDALLRIRHDIQAQGNVVAMPAAEVLEHDRNFATLEAVSLAMAIVAAAMSALNVITVLAMATQERTREIGIFSALGWSSRRIIESIVIEGMILCAIGCVLGIVLSFAAAAAAPHIPTIGRLVSLKPGISLVVPVIGAAFILCIFGALLPAWRAARMLPAEALRRL
jgi:putative ABC transport system permease protein